MRPNARIVQTRTRHLFEAPPRIVRLREPDLLRFLPASSRSGEIANNSRASGWWPGCRALARMIALRRSTIARITRKGRSEPTSSSSLRKRYLDECVNLSGTTDPLSEHRTVYAVRCRRKRRPVMASLAPSSGFASRTLFCTRSAERSSAIRRPARDVSPLASPSTKGATNTGKRVQQFVIDTA
jgi:hypothetical protein